MNSSAHFGVDRASSNVSPEKGAECELSDAVNSALNGRFGVVGGLLTGKFKFIQSWTRTLGPTGFSACKNPCDCPLAVRLAEHGYSNLMQRSHRWPGHERLNGVH